MPAAVRQYQSGLEPIALTIANGASLSDAADVLGKTVVAVVVPSAWTAAAISFDVSWDGGATFVPLYSDTAEVNIASAQISTTQSRLFAIDPVKFLGATDVKIRSGLNGTVVAQGAERAIKLLVRPM